MKTYERKQYNGIGQKKTARIKKKKNCNSILG